MLYHDRIEAGEKLAECLSGTYREKSPLILGIPRGGVAIATCMARMLDYPMSILISRKLSVPGNAEYGFGALGENGERYIAPFAEKSSFIKDIEDIIQKEQQEIDRRIQLYRNGQPLAELKGKTVIIVDDGIATGVTLVPALRLCRNKEAEKVIIAAPVSGTHFDENLLDADEIVIPERISSFRYVGAFYENFEQVRDEEVVKLLHASPEFI